jgi:hypothetical protein
MCPHILAEQNQGGGAENDDIPSTKRNTAGEVVEPGRRGVVFAPAEKVPKELRLAVKERAHNYTRVVQK